MYVLVLGISLILSKSDLDLMFEVPLGALLTQIDSCSYIGFSWGDFSSMLPHAPTTTAWVAMDLSFSSALAQPAIKFMSILTKSTCS